MARVAEHDVAFNGDVHFQRGGKILINLLAACHAPEHFEDTHTSIVVRAHNRHLVFGSGIHWCAGSNAVGLEITTALRVWTESTPEFSLQDGEPMEWAGGQVREPQVVPFKIPAGTEC